MATRKNAAATKTATRAGPLAAGLAPGDVVVRLKTGLSTAAGATVVGGTLGTVCRVVNPGRSYKVRYADLPFCVLAFHDSLGPAPAGSEAPLCEPDC
jgi:hypothetical protein